MLMATMATVMAKKSNKNSFLLLIPLSLASNAALAGEWTFEPNLGLTETYTNNVELTPENHQSSVVSQLITGIKGEFTSREVSLSFSGTETYAAYSHNSDLNDDFQTANIEGVISLWPRGPVLIANSSITNVSQNTANNSLADLVSGDMVQISSHNAGLQYQTASSGYNFDGSIIYNLTETEDRVGENRGYTAKIYTENGNAARNIFWQIRGEYADKENKAASGTKYSFEAGVGTITSFNLNPFLRYYDEDISGNIVGANQTSTRSWGPAIRWLVSDHLYIDVSYNYVADKEVSNDYVAANINWQPSQRTSLEAGYSQRFFGDSYNLDLQHKTKRLTNTLSYNETIEVFDRDRYEQIDVGIFWCPVDITITNISQCFAQSAQPQGESQLGTFFTLEPVESNEFSLNKQFLWSSKLELSKTSFTINSSATRRESIESKKIDDTLTTSFTIDRKISGRSNLTILAKYDYKVFDKDSLDDNQEDHYRTYSATYTKNLASSLSTHFTIQHVNRDSNIDRYSYDEIRAFINITKDF